MKHYSPTGRRNHGRLLKRLLDTWDRNGSTIDPIPWEINNDGDASFVIGVAEKLMQTILRSLIKLCSFTRYCMSKKQKREAFGCLLLPHAYTNWRAKKNQISNKQRNDTESYNKRNAIFILWKGQTTEIEDLSFIFSIIRVVLISSAEFFQLSLLDLDVLGGVGWRSKKNDVAKTWQHALGAAHISFADTHQ